MAHGKGGLLLKLGCEAGKGGRQEHGLGYLAKVLGEPLPRGADLDHVTKVGLISNYLTYLLHQLLEAYC